MGTLKISDLSVGDWVQDMYGNYSKVEGIWQGCNFSYQVDLHRDGVIGTIASCNIHPIPITPEILEANGFKEHCGGIFRYEWMWQGESSGITLHSFDEELWFVDLFFKEGKDIMCNIPTFSVHQFQHILRLAGVEKEIVIHKK